MRSQIIKADQSKVAQVKDYKTSFKFRIKKAVKQEKQVKTQDKVKVKSKSR